MILIDAGPIIALLDRHDNHHHECVEASKFLAAEPLLTTWPCFTEAMYLLGAVGGFSFQVELGKFIEEQQLTNTNRSWQDKGVNGEVSRYSDGSGGRISCRRR